MTDNGRYHQAKIVKNWFREVGIESMDQPAYFPEHACDPVRKGISYTLNSNLNQRPTNM